jgi:hypothetical protein
VARHTRYLPHLDTCTRVLHNLPANLRMFNFTQLHAEAVEWIASVFRRTAPTLSHCSLLSSRYKRKGISLQRSHSRQPAPRAGIFRRRSSRPLYQPRSLAMTRKRLAYRAAASLKVASTVSAESLCRRNGTARRSSPMAITQASKLASTVIYMCRPSG